MGKGLFQEHVGRAPSECLPSLKSSTTGLEEPQVSQTAPTGSERPTASSRSLSSWAVSSYLWSFCSTEEKVGSQRCSLLALLFQRYHLDKDEYPSNNNVTQKRLTLRPTLGEALHTKHFTPSQPPEAVPLTSLLYKRRQREVNQLSQGHTAGKGGARTHTQAAVLQSPHP